MNELNKLETLNIKTHDFEKVKKRLKDFSQTPKHEILITGKKIGFFSWSNSNTQLESSIENFQSELILLNNNVNKIIKEFEEIYNAMEFLDRDYINGILIAIKGIQKNHIKLEETQERTDKIVDALKQTIEKIKIFKSTIDSYEHLKDIDFLWEQNRALCNEITKIIGSLNELENNTESIYESIRDNNISIENINRKLNKITHLDDIDLIWTDTRNNKNLVETINRKLDNINHFNDIDFVWENSINNKNSIECINKKINNISHFGEIDSIWDNSINNKKEILELKKTILELENVKNEKNLNLKKANILSMVAIGISIVQLIFILTKVM